MPPISKDATQFLTDYVSGNARAADELMPLVYDELRRLAAAHMRAERADHTLQPTAVVNEAYLRLIKIRNDWKGRTHFFAMAATMLRRVLVDHAKHKGAKKHGAGWNRIALENLNAATRDEAVDCIALDAALEKLSKVSERQARAIELRFFAGLQMEEIGEVMKLGIDTVRKDLRMATAWLNRELLSA